MTDKDNFVGLDLAVICVPTPTASDDESCDTTIVEETLEWLTDIQYNGVVLIKSTVSPSDLKRFTLFPLRIVFSPEMMGESKYFTPEWKYPHPQKMESHSW